MHKNNYSLEVLVNGRPMQEYYKDSRSFVEARRGSEYTLRFRNNSWKRVMAIFSVDGIEVIKGRAASEADNGYIVEAFSSIEIKGYRIDEQNVAAFKFSDIAQGYNITVGATKVDSVTGEEKREKSSKNSGVIGVRVIEEDSADRDYKERYKPLSIYSINSAGSSSSNTRIFYSTCGINVGPLSGCLYMSGSTSYDFIRGFSGAIGSQGATCVTGGCPSAGYISDTLCMSGGGVSFTSSNASSSYLNFDTSTTWGGKLEDKVKEVSFKRSDSIADIEIFYASRESLVAYGIDFSNTKQIFSWPSAFEDRKQYCKLPPGYKL